MYLDKNTNYFNNARLDLISLIPNKQNNKVLEIGAGGCDTLLELKRTKIASEVVGVELMQLPGTNQNHPEIDKLIIGNIEQINLDVPENYFDVILCGDVLEHLIEPWDVLAKLHKFLKPDGVIIISVPNIREIETLYKIVVKADFRYSERGILDKTHLRFFCKKNILMLLKDALFKLVSIYSSFQIFDIGVFSWRRFINKLSLGLLRDFITRQYVVIAKKC